MLLHEEITSKIIQGFYSVYNELGYGFLEKVYRNAMVVEMNNHGLNTSCETSIKVFYKEIQVGSYFADIIVNEKVIVEIKCAQAICNAHICQLLNYLKSTDLEVGLLLNFGPKPEHKRKLFTADYKKKRAPDQL